MEQNINLRFRRSLNTVEALVSTYTVDGKSHKRTPNLIAPPQSSLTAVPHYMSAARRLSNVNNFTILFVYQGSTELWLLRSFFVQYRVTTRP
jgi:hypothetical protein